MSLALLERHDPFAKTRYVLREIARLKEEWAGVPMPLEGHPLVVEPTYPHAAELSKLGREEPEAPSPHLKTRSHFWSTYRRSEVLIWEDHSGPPKIEWGIVPGVHHFTQDLKTLGASEVWGLEQEARAVQLLATLLTHHHFKQYLLTGMFMEVSQRSGIHYVFRRLRPTIAITTRNDTARIIAALCLHPIAYYADSWAGAMCPTDDVIAHLMLMRGDEPLYWRRANQHPSWRPEAGL